MFDIFFGNLVYCKNCKDSRIQKAVDGFLSLPLNFNFELIDFWLCRRNIVFIVSDKFTRPIKLFLFEARKVSKRIEKKFVETVIITLEDTCSFGAYHWGTLYFTGVVKRSFYLEAIS